jgi:purine-binding chemotaxis protein CheW
MDNLSTAPAAHAPPLTFAQVELGGMLVGIAAGYVLRALPRPSALAQLPRSSGAIAGVFSDAGQVVPLVDLRRWMATEAGIEGVPAHVLVLGTGDRTIGLAVDAIRGLVRLPATRIRRVHHDDAIDGFFHSVATLDDGASLLSLLDPLRLMTQVQAWTCDEGAGGPGGPAADQAHADARAERTLFALVRIGSSVVAAPAAHAGEVVRQAQVQPLDLGDSFVTGMMQWRGAHVPVLDAARLLALDAQAGQPAPLMLVLVDGAHRAALPVDEVIGVREIDLARVEAPGDAGLPPGGLFCGVAQVGETGRALLLDTDTLLASHAPTGMAATGASAGDRMQAGAQQRDTLEQAHIVFSIGQDWALPMSSVDEIIAVPGGLAAPPGAVGGVAGNCDWRGRSLPVLDLRPSQDASRAQAQHLMVVHDGERHAALLVDHLVALLPPHAGSLSQFKLAGTAAVRMVTVGLPPARKSYRLMELGELAFFVNK